MVVYRQDILTRLKGIPIIHNWKHCLIPQKQLCSTSHYLRLNHMGIRRLYAGGRGSHDDSDIGHLHNAHRLHRFRPGEQEREPKA